MTWLDSELYRAELSDEDPGWRYRWRRDYKLILRMARVIRELVRLLKLHRQYSDVVHSEYAKIMGDAFNNASPDVKELLEDSQ